MRKNNSSVQKMLKGAVAGMMATLPMTIFMQAAWMRLPQRAMYALPPRWITRRFLRKTGARGHIDYRNETVLTLLFHFLFGAVMGALYGTLDEKLPGRESAKGIVAGMTVWSGSYLGWIPLFRILPPATRHPWRMNVLMIVAHFIWGISLGMLMKVLNPQKQYIKL